MKRLLPLVEYYEQSDTGYVRVADILTDMQVYDTYIRKYEHDGIIEVQWSQMPKIKLTEYGYETLKKLC